jgi:hypothetical protein
MLIPEDRNKVTETPQLPDDMISRKETFIRLSVEEQMVWLKKRQD